MDEVFKRLEASLDDFAAEWVDEFVGRVQARTPVKTGALRAGYDVQVDDNGVTVTNSQPYFWFIENGTRHISPVRMVERTLQEADQITAKVMKELDL